MSEFHLKVLEAAFTKAAEMPDAETREAHLRVLDTENPRLAAEVRRLLIARTKANRFFEAPLEVRMKMLMTTLGTSSIAGENESQAFLRSAAPPQKSGELARIGDHFALYELVASGSTGFVFRGFDCHLGRKIAIKALAPSVEIQAIQRMAFVEEARLASRIRHRNVVTIFHVEAGGQAEAARIEATGTGRDTSETGKSRWAHPTGRHSFCTMEWIDGDNLQAMIDRDLVGVCERAPEILSQLCQGITAIHDQGIVHRDIKPGNILVEGESGRVVIIDFGLAFETTVTEALFQPAGTPLFMSPEQIMGKKPTASSDQFSFALVAFQLLTGQHPFAGQSLEELAEQIRASRIRATPQTTQLSRAGMAVFERALAPSPDERFGSVQEFYDRLLEAEPRARVTAKDTGVAGVNLPDRTSNKSLVAAATSPTILGAALVLGLGVVSLALIGPQYFGRSSQSNGGTLAPEAMTTDRVNGGNASTVGTDRVTSDRAAESKPPQGMATWRRLDDQRVINSIGINFRMVPAPSRSFVEDKRAEFEGHPEYTDGIDWRYWVQDFLVSEEPISFRQYIAVMKKPPVCVEIAGRPYDLDAPVTGMLFREVAQFCQELTHLEGHGSGSYTPISLPRWSFAAYGDAMLSVPTQAEEVERWVLERNARETLKSKIDLQLDEAKTGTPRWVDKLHLKLPSHGLWELTLTPQPTFQELEGVVSLADWGRRRNVDEYLVVGPPDQDYFVHWFDLNNGCNDHFVSMENLEPFLESDGETSYLCPTEIGKPSSITYRYQAEDTIVSAEIHPKIYLYHAGDQGGVRIRARSKDSETPLEQLPWVDVVQYEGVSDKPIRTDITAFVAGKHEFELQYWIFCQQRPKHYAQIFRSALLPRDQRRKLCYVHWTTRRPRPSVRSSGPVPEHFDHNNLTFRIEYCSSVEDQPALDLSAVPMLNQPD